MGFVGRITQRSGAQADQAWKGFGQIDETVFQDLYYIFQRSHGDTSALGEEGAAQAINELAYITYRGFSCGHPVSTVNHKLTSSHDPGFSDHHYGLLHP